MAMDKPLRTWRLTPNKDSALWSQSSYRGEVWVRAHDAVEARKLTAQRFRVRPDRRRARMESPCYVRELSRCQADGSLQFDSVQIPCVVSPAPDGQCLPNLARTQKDHRVIATEVIADREHKADLPDSQTAPHDLVALDVRQAIVALLVAKEINVAGRWLDVYATRAVDNNAVYVVIAAAKLKTIISESLASLIERKLDDQEFKWTLSSAEVEKILGSDNRKIRAA